MLTSFTWISNVFQAGPNTTGILFVILYAVYSPCMTCICPCYQKIPQNLDIIGWMFSVQCRCTRCCLSTGEHSECRVRIRSSSALSRNWTGGLCSNCRNSCGTGSIYYEKTGGLDETEYCLETTSDKFPTVK